ncbi:unnamed protein product [Enterobius vermicularis]|uniref:Uncharacterized protein n=1 Tax=Enterobius vermicularis TaxID=51028 RepID=A0A0N4VDP9_ENTVE|nr:unnamed protein product [Enterobius vermicularis]
MLMKRLTIQMLTIQKTVVAENFSIFSECAIFLFAFLTVFIGHIC